MRHLSYCFEAPPDGSSHSLSWRASASVPSIAAAATPVPGTISLSRWRPKPRSNSVLPVIESLQSAKATARLMRCTKPFTWRSVRSIPPSMASPSRTTRFECSTHQPGTEAVTRVLIDMSNGSEQWTTIGVSENIVEASWQALVDGIVYGLLHAPTVADTRRTHASTATAEVQSRLAPVCL